MLKRTLAALAALAMLFSIGGIASAAISEREPNDTPQQATPLGSDLAATGVFQRNDQDWYKLTLPAPSKVTATVSGFPGDCQVQVLGVRSDGATGLGAASGTISFDAPAGDLYIRVVLQNVASGLCSGSDWCAVQCAPQGPWHVTPEKDGTPPKKVPASYEGKPVQGPISYRLQVTSSATPTVQTQPPGTQPPGTLPPPTQPPPVVTQPPPTQPPTPQRPQGELVKNPGMKGPGNWTIVEWYKPSNGKGEVSFDADGVRFRSQSGNNRIGVLQEVNQDVSGCGHLVLTAIVKADQHTLTGTGYNGREAPIAVFMKYADVNGMVHDLLSENPHEARNMFWSGFYYLDPTAPSVAANGTKIGRGGWFTYTADLAGRNPRPRHVYFIGAEGAGWPVRDGKINGLSLQCR
jgi:hypothetical protein